MRTVIGQLVWRSTRRLLGLLLLIVLLLVSTGAAIVVQGGRDEASAAETAVLVDDGTALSRAARIDRTLDLYLSGHVSHIIVVGADPGATEGTLLNRGVQSVKLRAVRAPTQAAQMDELRNALLTGRPIDGMLIAEPVETLRLLKMVHDRGLSLHGSPSSQSSAIDLARVIDEVVRYFAYVLGKR